ncbi:hypothetical protein D3C85_1437380 [compost metagenome]
MHDQLPGHAVGADVSRVLAGVEQVMDAGCVRKDAARVGVEVQVAFTAVAQRNAVVLKLREVFCGDEIPRGAWFRV